MNTFIAPWCTYKKWCRILRMVLGSFCPLCTVSVVAVTISQFPSFFPVKPNMFTASVNKPVSRRLFAKKWNVKLFMLLMLIGKFFIALNFIQKGPWFFSVKFQACAHTPPWSREWSINTTVSTCHCLVSHLDEHLVQGSITFVWLYELVMNRAIWIKTLISLHIRSMWETTVMHKQVSGWTVNFGPNSPVYPFLELKTRIPPPPPFQKTSDLGWPKFTPEYPPPISENFRFGMTKVYSGIPPPPPHFRKLQIWDDQSLLRNTPPPFQKTSDLGWPKFTPEYPPPPPPPHFRKLQIWDDQSLLWNIPPPPFQKTSDLGWPKFTPDYPPPHFRKLQIWDDQSLFRNPPPILENFRFGMTKVYSGIPPPPKWKLSESPSPRFSEYRELLHVETLSNPDNY